MTKQQLIQVAMEYYFEGVTDTLDSLNIQVENLEEFLINNGWTEEATIRYYDENF